MGLQSALSTALTGMTAAETSIDVAGNNVANANTVGFKESNVNFATQFLQTQSIGSAPTGSRGGTNPRQIGLGAKVSEITPDFTGGTIEISSNPLDLAIQGDGFFIVQGPQGEQYYTRNGQFKTNGKNEIVTLTGHRVLGYSVDANFNIQPTGLQPMTIPLGAAAVAQATQGVTMKGALNPDVKEVGTKPEIIQSGILSDGSREVPQGVPDVAAMTRPTTSSIQWSVASASTNTPPTFPAGTYNYKIVYVDAQGNEGPPSNVMARGLTADQDWIQLDNIPQPTDPDLVGIRIYRQDPTAGAEYVQVRELDISGGAVDTYRDERLFDTTNELNDSALSNSSYSYYVTFYHSSSGDETRPTARFGPVTADFINQPRIRLDNIPSPTTLDYDMVRIYRNIPTDPNSYFLVDTIDPGEPYIDSKSDVAISSGPSTKKINLDGPPIREGMNAIDLVSRSGGDYTRLFGIGELKFSGDKGGRQMAERTFNITANTSVQELLTFMEQSMGVLKDAPESTFPGGENYDGALNLAYGGAVVDSRLQFTSNLGEENALSIDLSAFKFTPAAGGETQTVQFPFNSVQEANGAGASADFIVYDSLGTPLNVRVTTVLEEISSTGARFRWIATSPQNDPESGFTSLIGTGTITTDGKGKFISASNDRVAIERGESPANSPLEFNLDFSQVTGLSQNANELSAAYQDGFPAGTLTSFIITESGSIQGVFSNGSSRDLGQLRMARFANNGGLQQVGDNMFAAGVNSGLPIQGNPGSGGMGAVTTGAVELSNTDIGQNLIELIMASTQYRGGARVITAVQQLLDELLALRR